LSPAYDLLNTTILMENTEEEMALPIAGKKKKIHAEILFKYFGGERMQLTDKVLNSEAENFVKKKPLLENLAHNSFLNEKMKRKYSELIDERYLRLETDGNVNPI